MPLTYSSRGQPVGIRWPTGNGNWAGGEGGTPEQVQKGLVTG